MSENNPFYCSFVGTQYIICECGEACPSEEALKEHIQKDHQKTKVEVVQNDEHLVELTEYKCGECGEIYNTEEECVKHQEQDHLPLFQPDLTYDEKPYIVYYKQEPYVQEDYEDVGEQLCLRQDEEFILPEEVVPKGTAMRGVDSPTLVYSGPPRSMMNRQTEKQQIEQAKPKQKKIIPKNIVCEVCGKKYASNAALRYHQRAHTGVRPYACTFCSKTFTMSLFLQIHIRSHTGEKPYTCENCPKAFTNKAALLRHERVHTGVKPYQCPRCGKSFTQSNSMKLHVRTVHLKLPAPYKSKKRQAEARVRQARKARTTGDGTRLQMQGIKSEDCTEEVYEMQEGEIFYCDVVPKDEITYEVAKDDITYEVSKGDITYEVAKDDITYEVAKGDITYEVAKDEVTYEVIYE